jgi:hypothetical protein
VQYRNLLLLAAKSDRCAELLAWSDVTASVISRYWRHISSALSDGSLFSPTQHKPPAVTPLRTSQKTAVGTGLYMMRNKNLIYTDDGVIISVRTIRRAVFCTDAAYESVSGVLGAAQ